MKLRRSQRSATREARAKRIKGHLQKEPDQAEQINPLRKVGKAKKHLRWNGGLEVSEALANSKLIGRLCSSLAGMVDERLRRGINIAVKFGRQFDPYQDEDDEFAHADNEIKMQEALAPSQGSIITKVVAAGLEKLYSPGYMLSITEKVGEPLYCDNGSILVDDAELSHENLRLVEEKGRDGLDAIHGCDVLHRDTRSSDETGRGASCSVDGLWNSY